MSEIEVLSGCLTTEAFKIRNKVKSEFFSNSLTGKLFDILVDFNLKHGIPMSKETLKKYVNEQLSHEEKLEIEPLVSKLNPDIPKDLLYLRVDNLVEAFKRREYKSLGNQIASEVGGLDVMENKIRTTLSRVESLTGDGILQEDFTSKESFETFKKYVEELENPENSILIPSGIDEIDISTGGGKKGELWMYVAYTSHGKSTMLLNHAYEAVVKHKKNVLFCSCELKLDDIKKDFHALHAYKSLGVSSLDTSNIRLGKLSDIDKEQLFRAGEDLTSNKYGTLRCIQAVGSLDIRDLFYLAEQTNKEVPLDMIVIDYLTKLPPMRRRNSTSEEHGETVKYAQKMSIDFDGGEGILVVSGHQINRQGFERARRRSGEWQGVYLPSDMFMTSEAEKSPDMIVSLFKASALESMDEDEDGVKSEIIMAIIKNRDGKVFPEVPRFYLEAHLQSRSLKSQGQNVGSGSRPFDHETSMSPPSIAREPERMDDDDEVDLDV